MFAIGNILQGIAYVLDTVLFLYMWLIIIRALIALEDELGGEPLIVYTGDMGAEAGELLPQAYLMDFLDAPAQPPVIYWNSLRDLSASKSIHISNQAFYLRRYARRVAQLWEQARREAG